MLKTMIDFTQKIMQVNQDAAAHLPCPFESALISQANEDSLIDALAGVSDIIESLSDHVSDMIEQVSERTFNEEHRLIVRIACMNAILLRQMETMNEELIERLSENNPQAADKLRYSIFHDMPCEYEIEND